MLWVRFFAKSYRICNIGTFFVIILEPKHTQLLIDHLKLNPINPPWDNNKIIATLQTDLDEKEARTACEHTIANYIGKKTCCTKCGGYPIGEGFSWKLLEVADTATPTSN